MPSETEKGVIKPLAANAVQLIKWRLRSIDTLESRVVLEGMHTCAHCHSFSGDGKTMGNSAIASAHCLGSRARVEWAKIRLVKSSKIE